MRTAALADTQHSTGTWAGVAFRLAAIGLVALFAMADPAAAQSTESTAPACPDGLMRRGEAGTGTLLLKTQKPGCYLGAPRVAADITVDVSGPVARTRVTQRFENPSDVWVEGIYLFPLPEGAAVDTLRLQVGTRFIQGEIKERQEARVIYERAREEGRVASLVEEERPNMFTNQVANIGPRQVVTVQIEYQEGLRFENGRYSLRVPLVVGPRYSPEAKVVVASGYGDGHAQLPRMTDPVPDRERIEAPVLRPEWGKVNPVKITVRVEAGFPLGIIESRSHGVTVARTDASNATVKLRNDIEHADRDFTLSFAATAGNMPGVSLLRETVNGQDYAMALIMPPSTGFQGMAKPRESIFVLDNSGSMAGESMKQAKAAMLIALDRLNPRDRFNVIRFDDTFTVFFPNPVPATPENVARAKEYVAGLDANGGTEMLPALLAALSDSDPTGTTHLRQVVFVTDGGVSNEAELFSAIGNRLGRTRLFTVGIGSAPNSYFMAGAARAGRGTYTYIGSADEVVPRMREMLAKLERPVMTDLAAHWPNSNASETWPSPLPDLYAGEPVVLTARMARLNGALVLSGRLNGQPWRVSLDLSQARSARGVERLWARNKIAALEESRVRGADPTAIDKGVLEVALAHHLTSRLTSLVAVDVTPSRPNGTPMATRQVPLNLPAGWDFDKVFGPAVPVRDAGVDVPEELLDELAPSRHAHNATEPENAELDLPQGSTESRLLLLIGLTLLTLGLVSMRRRPATQVR
jgi:Ca-activated chloride channel family protein